MKSKTKIGKQVEKKKNIVLVETILNAKKQGKWIKIASLLSYPRRKRKDWNLDEIDENSKEGETLVAPGKVLSQGEINKKIKIVALGFSEQAKEKLLKSKIAFSSISEEIKKNPEAKNIRILSK